MNEPPPAGPSETVEERSTSVELLWDLVFAFALTQVTTLLAGELTWAGLGRSMLVLALLWWAWSAFVWAVNAELTNAPVLRLVLLPATALIFLTGLALPRAFAGEGALFAGSYALVRLLHLALYADASRRGHAAWSALVGFFVTVIIGMVLLLAGALVSEPGRLALWTAAVAIDYAGPAWLTRDRLRALQPVAVAHFAERYGLFVIICLGESIVSVGAAAVGSRSGVTRGLNLELVVAVSLCLLITVGLWWAYFGAAADITARRLREHPDPVIAAADGYSYLHLPLVAGIIIFAVGARLLVRASPSATLSGPVRLALCGGVALYLLAHVSFSRRFGDVRVRWRVVAAGVLLVVWITSGGVPGWVLAGVVAAVLAGLFGVEGVDLAVPAEPDPPAVDATAPTGSARAAESSCPPEPYAPRPDRRAG